MIYLFLFLILICIIDIELKVIPDVYILIGSIWGIKHQLANGNLGLGILGFIVGILAVWLINKLKIQRLGGGDAKLMGMIGLYTNPLVVLTTLVLAYLLFIPYKYFSYKRSIAYAPFITIALSGVILCQNVI